MIHGDQFDAVVKYAKWLAHLGDKAYTGLLAVNTWFNHVRRKLGFTYWSLSAYLKHRVKNAVDTSEITRRRWPTRLAVARSMESSADIFTALKYVRWKGCSIATTAIGSNPGRAATATEISRLGGFTSLAASQGGSVKILIVSDAWYPQVNGVVRTLATVRDELVKLGHSVEIIGPDRFRTVPCRHIRKSGWRSERDARWRN